MYDWRNTNIIIEYLQGIYQASGYDTTLFNDNNFPKVYFYGKYKYVGRLKNKYNKVVGCIAAELNVVRPWESTMNWHLPSLIPNGYSIVLHNIMNWLVIRDSLTFHSTDSQL